MGNSNGFMRLWGAVTVAAVLVAAAPGVSATAAAGVVPSFERGPMTAFVASKAPASAPEIAFKDGEGNPLSLAAWRGRVVLVNLWATWCAPCRREMPALDRLQAKLGGDDFEVVAISVDRKGIAASSKFLDDAGAENLALYVDESFQVARDFKVPGLPVTILIDRQGREVGRLTGPAEWDSEDALSLIAATIGLKAAAR